MSTPFGYSKAVGAFRNLKGKFQGKGKLNIAHYPHLSSTSDKTICTPSQKLSNDVIPTILRSNSTSIQLQFSPERPLGILNPSSNKLNTNTMWPSARQGKQAKVTPCKVLLQVPAFHTKKKLFNFRRKAILQRRKNSVHSYLFLLVIF
jgi:hypothetical protein